MAKLIEEIAAKLSAEAAKEFKEAVKGMNLADLATGEYVSKGKAEAELATAKKSLEDLTAKFEKVQADASKGGETTAELEKKLKEAMDAHKAEVAELKTGAEREKKAARVKQDLTQAGAWDADIAFTALGVDLDKLDFDDKGNLVGLSDRIKALQEGKTRLFEVKEPGNKHIPTGPDGPKTVDDEAKAALAELGIK